MGSIAAVHRPHRTRKAKVERSLLDPAHRAIRIGVERLNRMSDLRRAHHDLMPSATNMPRAAWRKKFLKKKSA